MIDGHLLEMAIEFHGHTCPAMPLGIRVGLAAMNALGVERAKNKELYCLCETGPAHAAMCFGDGVQVATGCTFGKANIESLGYSKSAITLIEVKSKRAVRVVLNPEFQKMALSSEFVKLRAQGVEPQDIKSEITDPLVEKACSLPDEEILIVGEVFNIAFEPRKGTFEWHECDNCGEVVFAHGLRVVNNKHFCIPCSGYK
ncbi:formylmethanofuran dehydrogenase [Methanosarcinales archaeon]|nr:MAG: formylmethanofuran dehydrogenase [Methanosarcinales archaeon]